jgi:glycosyltransferase involved in cell wall biosynthesis
MNDGIIDILMITYNRPDYTRLSLARLLDTCDETMRVWLWHNGEHAETLDVVKAMANHPRVHHFHHSVENKRLREPTNWFWQNADGAYVSKIDDDNLMTPGWGQRLRAAHEAEPRLGVLGCWSFLEQDVVPRVAERKVRDVGNGQRIMQNCWVAGTGYVMKRQCCGELGQIREGQSFPNYCIELALRGWIHGWPYPFVYMENLDDPRHPLTRLKTESDFHAGKGLSAVQFGVRSLDELRNRQRLIAMELQEASINPRAYVGWRGRLHRVARKFRFRRGAAV